jgi:hypothetical protein
MICYPRNEASSPGFRHRLWLSKNENCITNQGYNINHKKVYRLMKGSIYRKTSKPSKTRVKYRKVFQVSL